MTRLPGGLISFGKNANCTLELCPVSVSILEYQPSIPGNAAIIVLFLISMIVHILQGVKFRAWDFMICMIIGCVDEIIGYIGRIMLNKNPFSFGAFVIQTVCITTAPVFFCSAIYVMLSRTITHLEASLSRLKPKLFIWIFIPCDIVSLIAQAAGGALSSVQAGTSNKSGVHLSQAGLILQVITLCVFIGLFIDYVVRYQRHPTARSLTSHMKLFFAFLFLSILFVLIRCAFRIDELSDGYDGALIHNEPIFMGLEATMMALAVLCLHIGHPGVAFGTEPGNEMQLISKTSEEVIGMSDIKSVQYNA